MFAIIQPNCDILPSSLFGEIAGKSHLKAQITLQNFQDHVKNHFHFRIHWLVNNNNNNDDSVAQFPSSHLVTPS